MSNTEQLFTTLTRTILIPLKTVLVKINLAVLSYNQ